MAVQHKRPSVRGVMTLNRYPEDRSPARTTKRPPNDLDRIMDGTAYDEGSFGQFVYDDATVCIREFNVDNREGYDHLLCHSNESTSCSI